MVALLFLFACDNEKIGLEGGDDTGITDSGDTATDTDTGPPPLADITVDCEGGADYTEIQPAIDAAHSGDVIAVRPCEYHERLDFLGKTIEVYGIEGSGETILDADDEGTALNVETGEGDGTRFAGFTIRGGYDTSEGAAVEIAYSALELEDVVITASVGNSMVTIVTGWVDMKDVTLTGNEVTEDAIWVDSGILTAEGLDVDCDGGENAIWHHVALNLDRSRIVCDSGNGIENYHGTTIIQRSYIYGGEDGLYSYDEESTPETPDDPSEENFIYASAIGGGSRGAHMLYQYVIVENSVLWGSDAALSVTACSTSSYAMNSVFLDAACGIEADQPLASPFSAFYGNAANGCGLQVTPAVSADPLFTDFPDDLTLRAGSPLIDAGNPDPLYADPDGTTNDIGRYGGLFGE